VLICSKPRGEVLGKTEGGCLGKLDLQKGLSQERWPTLKEKGKHKGKRGGPSPWQEEDSKKKTFLSRGGKKAKEKRHVKEEMLRRTMESEEDKNSKGSGKGWKRKQKGTDTKSQGAHGVPERKFKRGGDASRG